MALYWKTKCCITAAAPDLASLGGYGRDLPAMVLVGERVLPAPLGRLAKPFGGYSETYAMIRSLAISPAKAAGVMLGDFKGLNWCLPSASRRIPERRLRCGQPPCETHVDGFPL